MIVSTAIAVLPVWRSPMISSRWPRPIGIIASMAFRPVCSGSTTGWRWTTPGALNSAGRRSSLSIGPLPSSGLPSGSTMRPSRASPTGISMSSPVRLTVSPSTILSHSPKSTTPTLSDSRFSARPVTSWGSSSFSNDMQLSRPWTRQMPSATDRTVPTSVRSACPSSRPSIRLLRMDVISSGLICSGMRVRAPPVARLAAGDLSAKLFESVADGRVEDRVADAQHDAAENVGLDRRREVDLAVRLLGDAIPEVLDDLLVELDRRGHLHGQELVLLAPQLVVVAADAMDHGHPVLLEQQLEEVQEDRLRAVDRLVQALLLLLRREVRREEERGQRAVLVEGVDELGQLLADLVELVLVARDLEERSSVDLGDLLHAPLLPPARERLEVELGQGLLDQPALVVLVERLARHLLGGHDREIGDLRADLRDRAARLGLDVAARLLHQLLALDARLLDRLALRRLGGLARTRDDLLGLLAR